MIVRLSLLAIVIAQLVVGPRVAGAEAPPPTQIVIVSDPPGAALTVDGQDAGTAPTTMRGLLPGDHLVHASWPDGRSATSTVRAQSGMSVLLQLAPAASPSGTPPPPAPEATPPSPAAPPAAAPPSPAPATTTASPSAAPPTAAAPAYTIAVTPAATESPEMRSARHTKQAGMGLTIAGIVLFVFGVAAFATAPLYYSSCTSRLTGGSSCSLNSVVAGGVLTGLSVGLLGPGIPLWVVGAARQSRLRRAVAFVSPTGFALRF